MVPNAIDAWENALEIFMQMSEDEDAMARAAILRSKADYYDDDRGR